jgi:hypothetical protein
VVGAIHERSQRSVSRFAPIANEILRRASTRRFAHVFAVAELDEFCTHAVPTDTRVEDNSMAVDQILALTHDASRKVDARASR